MKKIVFTSLILINSLFASNYSSYEASQHIGEDATICGEIVSGYYASKSNGQPTFLNMDNDYPNQIFTVVIWGESRHNFNNPETKYTNKNICVSGTIKSHKNIPQIIVKSPSQISEN